MTGLLELLEWGKKTGYIAMVRPLTFDEQVELQRSLRDWEEEHGPFVVRLTKDAIELDAEDDLPPQIVQPDPPRLFQGPTREQVLASLDACAGNQTRAAKHLGVARQTLLRYIDLYRIPRPKIGLRD